MTQLAPVGTTVQPGQPLYTLDGSHRVVLLRGNVPAWRTLKAGVTNGPDVHELEQNLQALGYTSSAMQIDTHWDAETTAAVKRWQKALGVPQTGVVTFGSVVFEPGPLRITADTAALGSTLQAGAAVLQATTTSRVVTVALDPALQTEVKQGDAVSVVLPDNSTVPGHVSNVGTVATQASSGSSGGIHPTAHHRGPGDPRRPVRGRHPRPGTGKREHHHGQRLGRAGGARAGARGPARGRLRRAGRPGRAALHYVRVTLGIFANGWVQVAALAWPPGQTVVVGQ